MAALLSESGVIGVVGGREDVPPVVRFVNGYEMGAKAINPDIQVLKVYNESFTDPNKGTSDARAVHRRRRRRDLRRGRSERAPAASPTSANQGH